MAKLKTVVFPALGSSLDLWFVRVSGHGLGNSFFNYFHAVVLAQRYGADVVTPPWFSIKLARLIGRNSSKRMYFRMFKPYRGEIRGIAKLWVLTRGFRRRSIVRVSPQKDPELLPGVLNIVGSDKFTFVGLHPYRGVLRERLLAIVNHPIPSGHSWGAGGYIAVHVRLGDFIQVVGDRLVSGTVANVRIPMTWYRDVLAALRQRHPDRRVLVFSDGNAEDLKPLIDLGAEVYRSGSDITDLLVMSGASLLVGSNSTYSRWAAFLGDMPTVWLKQEVQAEKPSGERTPIYYVGVNPGEIDALP
jgi:hypothetical protein